jgi:hypothetical protein
MFNRIARTTLVLILRIWGNAGARTTMGTAAAVAFMKEVGVEVGVVLVLVMALMVLVMAGAVLVMAAGVEDIMKH